jgi:hypothetical protein
VTLDFNTAQAANGVGQYVTGTFTADGTSQAVSIVGDIASDGTGLTGLSPQIGAFDVEVLAPEPASAGLIVLGVSTLAFRRRRHA